MIKGKLRAYWRPALGVLALALIGGGIAQFAMSPKQPAFFAKAQVKVLGSQRGPGGLTVWNVERNGAKTVFYTTADGHALISGVIWDATSGANLSDAFITTEMAAGPDVSSGVAAAQAASATPQAQAPTPDMKQFSPDKIPDAIRGISTLAGIKEGNAGIEKTLYVVFDPRCSHCHNVYRDTRDFVAAGGTVKWIPVTVIGSSINGEGLSAEIMESKTPGVVLKSVMASRRDSTATASALTKKLLAENEAYLFAAFSKNPAAGDVGVPVAFFMDKGGVPQMIAGIDDPVLLPKILSEVKR